MTFHGAFCDRRLDLTTPFSCFNKQGPFPSAVILTLVKIIWKNEGKSCRFLDVEQFFRHGALTGAQIAVCHIILCPIKEQKSLKKFFFLRKKGFVRESRHTKNKFNEIFDTILSCEFNLMLCNFSLATKI